MPIPATQSVDPRMYEPSIARAIQSGYDEDHYYADLVKEVSSESVSPNYKSGVKAASYIPVGAMRSKGNLEPVVFDAVQAAFLVEAEHTEYGLAIATSTAALEDESNSVLRRAHEELGKSYPLLLNEQAAGMYDELDTTTVITGPDAVAIASKVHPHPNVAVTTTRSNIPEDDGQLAMATLKSAIICGMRMTNLSGKPAPIWKLGQTLKLLVQPEDQLDALALVNSIKNPGNIPASASWQYGDSADNIFKNFNIQVVCNPYMVGLTSTICNWFLMKPESGIELVVRRGLARNTYTDPDSGALVTKVTARHCYFPREWEYLVMGGTT